MTSDIEEIHENNRLLTVRMKELDKLVKELELATQQYLKYQEKVVQINNKIKEILGV